MDSDEDFENDEGEETAMSKGSSKVINMAFIDRLDEELKGPS